MIFPAGDGPDDDESAVFAPSERMGTVEIWRSESAHVEEFEMLMYVQII